MVSFQQISNFAVAAFKHLKNGRPKASYEIIIERLNICLSCKLFERFKQKGLNPEMVHGICTHKRCGCTITSNDEQKFFNKIAWADQECPLGKWSAIKKGPAEAEPLDFGNDYY